jgi:hypothetical protein
VLDVLHLPDTTVLCRVGTWHGGSGLLAGWIDPKDGIGEIKSTNPDKDKEHLTGFLLL